jgi:hypothetical protein
MRFFISFQNHTCDVRAITTQLLTAEGQVGGEREDVKNFYSAIQRLELFERFGCLEPGQFLIQSIKPFRIRFENFFHRARPEAPILAQQANGIELR